MSKKVKAAMPDLKRMYACCIKKKLYLGIILSFWGMWCPKINHNIEQKLRQILYIYILPILIMAVNENSAVDNCNMYRVDHLEEQVFTAQMCSGAAWRTEIMSKVCNIVFCYGKFIVSQLPVYFSISILKMLGYGAIIHTHIHTHTPEV